MPATISISAAGITGTASTAASNGEVAARLEEALRNLGLDEAGRSYGSVVGPVNFGDSQAVADAVAGVCKEFLRRLSRAQRAKQDDSGQIARIAAGGFDD